MDTNFSEIKVRGRLIKVPSIRIYDKTIVVTGNWIRVAVVRSEDWSEGQGVADPKLFIEKLKESGLKADIFTFAQKIPDVKPRYKYHMEWDNVAAIPITSFQDWWERVSSDMRKDVKRAEKREIIVKPVEFDDELVNGIVGIHNDTPMKQGEPFAHYGKEFGVVKEDYGTYLDRSEFVGAYFKNELIGIIKIVYVGDLACLMQILSKDQHNDKRPTNALIAKAVEICAERGSSYLTYGKYYYGNKRKSSLVDFKHRNGFRCILFPRYYIPLTLKGKIAIRLRLHLGLLGLLPSFLIPFLLSLRSKIYQRILVRFDSSRRIKRLGQDKRLTDGQR